MYSTSQSYKDVRYLYLLPNAIGNVGMRLQNATWTNYKVIRHTWVAVALHWGLVLSPYSGVVFASCDLCSCSFSSVFCSFVLLYLWVSLSFSPSNIPGMITCNHFIKFVIIRAFSLKGARITFQRRMNRQRWRWCSNGIIRKCCFLLLKILIPTATVKRSHEYRIIYWVHNPNVQLIYWPAGGCKLPLYSLVHALLLSGFFWYLFLIPTPAFYRADPAQN